MLIPLGHEQMTARRWPVITFALIALNVLAFLATFHTMVGEQSELRATKLHVLILAGLHPELNAPPKVQKLIDNVRTVRPDLWNEIRDPQRPPDDDYEARIRELEDPAELQAEMDSISEQYLRLSAASILERYAFIPAAPSAVSYLTANFLHGGWLHLIGNMWFLWLAGFVLEDVWGRVVYSVIYLISGVAALQFYAFTNAGSLVPTLGASGAVAALMGAFLIRFPRLKIDMAWIYWFRLYRFKMAAYWLLPMWLLTEIFYGSLFGTMAGVAHWAHVGGFVFGAAVALGLKLTGMEHKLNQAVEEKVSYSADRELLQAEELLEKNQPDQAIALIQAYAARKPGSLDAAMLLPQAYWRKGDVPAYQQAMLALCQAYLRQRQLEPAWHTYLDFLQSGAERKLLAPALWLDLARAAESLGDYDRAIPEFEQLIAAHPGERQSLQAHLALGRIMMKVGAPQKALAHYEAAKASPIPHLDIEPQIELGIRQARAALGGQAAAAGR